MTLRHKWALGLGIFGIALIGVSVIALPMFAPLWAQPIAAFLLEYGFFASSPFSTFQIMNLLLNVAAPVVLGLGVVAFVHPVISTLYDTFKWINGIFHRKSVAAVGQDVQLPNNPEQQPEEDLIVQEAAPMPEDPEVKAAAAAAEEQRLAAEQAAPEAAPIPKDQEVRAAIEDEPQELKQQHDKAQESPEAEQAAETVRLEGDRKAEQKRQVDQEARAERDIKADQERKAADRLRQEAREEQERQRQAKLIKKQQAAPAPTSEHQAEPLYQAAAAAAAAPLSLDEIKDKTGKLSKEANVAAPVALGLGVVALVHPVISAVYDTFKWINGIFHRKNVAAPEDPEVRAARIAAEQSRRQQALMQMQQFEKEQRAARLDVALRERDREYAEEQRLAAEQSAAPIDQPPEAATSRPIPAPMPEKNPVESLDQPAASEAALIPQGLEVRAAIEEERQELKQQTDKEQEGLVAVAQDTQQPSPPGQIQQPQAEQAAETARLLERERLASQYRKEEQERQASDRIRQEAARLVQEKIAKEAAPAPTSEHQAKPLYQAAAAAQPLADKGKEWVLGSGVIDAVVPVKSLSMAEKLQKLSNGIDQLWQEVERQEKQYGIVPERQGTNKLSRSQFTTSPGFSKKPVTREELKRCLDEIMDRIRTLSEGARDSKGEVAVSKIDEIHKILIDQAVTLIKELKDLKSSQSADVVRKWEMGKRLNAGKKTP